jgi:hypothetical protein
MSFLALFDQRERLGIIPNASNYPIHDSTGNNNLTAVISERGVGGEAIGVGTIGSAASSNVATPERGGGRHHASNDKTTTTNQCTDWSSSVTLTILLHTTTLLLCCTSFYQFIIWRARKRSQRIVQQIVDLVPENGPLVRSNSKQMHVYVHYRCMCRRDGGIKCVDDVFVFLEFLYVCCVVAVMLLYVPVFSTVIPHSSPHLMYAFSKKKD